MSNTGTIDRAIYIFYALIITAVLFLNYKIPLLPDEGPVDATLLETLRHPANWAWFFGSGIGFFSLLGLGITFAGSSLPEALIPIPHKAYWFHPSRKRESLARFKLIMLTWCGSSLIALIFIMQNAFTLLLADTLEKPLASTSVRVLYLIILGAIVIWFRHLFQPGKNRT